MSLPRADASRFLHSEPLWKAVLAAFTARSTSCCENTVSIIHAHCNGSMHTLSASATSMIFFSLTGLIVGKVFLLAASTNSLLMKS